MKIKSILILIAFNMMALPVVAQEQHKMLKGDENIAREFRDAFVPPPKTRQFMAEPRTDQAEAPANIISVRVGFKTNSALLTAEAQQILKEVGRAMNFDQMVDLEFIIEGHTDPRGGLDLNQRLSEARAQAVLDYLVWNTQVDRGRLTAVGKNYSELLNTENLIAPENRRVTFKLNER